MQLIFVSVWFYWWAKHIPCLCLPCLWHSRNFWGWALHPVELSALPMEQAQAAMTWRREQSEYLPRAGQPGDLEYVERRCIPGQPLWPEKSRHQPQDSFGTGLVSDLNVWLWAQLPWLAPDPAFQGDTHRIVTICPLEMTFHTPAHSKDTGRFHSWLRGQGCWPLLSSLVCNQ